jgi:lauroyl/myristoyl acyltransferase
MAGFLWLCAWLPLPLSRLIGAGLGLVMYANNAKRRRIARVNIDMCFPQLTPAERNRRLRRHYIVSGQSFVDLGLLAWGARRRVRRATHFRGLHHYLDEVKRGRNVILLVPHTVGMNFTGAALAGEHAMFGLIKPVRDPVMDWVLHKGRTRFGCLLYQRTGGLRPVVRSITEGMTFYYLPDEDLGPRHSLFAPFFGVPAATLTTLGRMARLTGACVVPCFTRILPGGRGYEMWFEPPLADFPSGNEQRDAERMNQVLEAGLSQAPEQYMWTFKLFKTRPDNAPSPYDD